MFEIVFLVFVSGYFLVAVAVSAGVVKRINVGKGEPKVSVVLAARNEEENIKNVLNSLSELDYPEGLLEIVVVNDDSSDETDRLIDGFISEYNGKHNFIKLFHKSGGKLLGKPAALDAGIRNATGEIIFTTDADCVVNKQWIRSIVKYYSEETGMVNGFTIIKSDSLFTGIQGIDLIYLLTIASGLINKGYPVSCIGNNMSFRKKAYLETGGFEANNFSLTEDAQLLQKIADLKRYRIKYPLDNEGVVETKGAGSIKVLTEQKKRWGVGAARVPWYGMGVLLIAYFTNLCMIGGVLFLSEVYLYLAVFKITIDLFLVYPVHHRLGLVNQLKYFLPFQLYLILYITLTPFILLVSKKVTWKGREYAASM